MSFSVLIISLRPLQSLHKVLCLSVQNPGSFRFLERPSNVRKLIYEIVLIGGQEISFDKRYNV